MMDDNFSHRQKFNTITISSASLDDISLQDSAAFNYICDLSPARPINCADTGQALSGFYNPNNGDTSLQGPQVCQPSNAQLYQNGERNEDGIIKPGALEKYMTQLSSEVFPDTKTQRETVPRNCEGQYQEKHVAPQLVQSLHMTESFEGFRSQLEDGAQKYAMRGPWLSREVHLNNVQTFPSASNHLNNFNSSAALLNSVNVDSHGKSLSISKKMKLTGTQQSVKNRVAGSPFTIPKASGIGLHLNSVVSPFRASGIEGATSNELPKAFGIGLHLNSTVSPFRASGIEGATSNELKACKNKERPKSAAIISCHLLENMEVSPISSSVADNVLAHDEVSWQKLVQSSQLNLESKSSSAHRKRKFFSERMDSNEQQNQSSSNALGTLGGEGCKRCNCSKTKCLKLYCDCFAAGVYCAGPCACQDCYNRPEYEDKVLETRRQIEYRNPSAFSPKVLQDFTGPTETSVEELTPSAPSIARHKTGCNCKKSMCMKKYCECYKESVGCSEGCRCEGCKNEFGKREDDNPYVPTRQRVSHGKEELRAKFLFTPYQPSPESDLTVLSSTAKASTSTSHSNSNTHKETLDIAPNERELLNYGFEERADPSSPSYDTIALCDIIKDPPSQSYALDDTTSPANVPSSVAPGYFKTRDSIGSSRWRSIVPIGERINLGGFNPHKGLDRLDDGTSEILKEVVPINTVNVHSPKRQRVRLHELCSNSQVSFKSGRKFILQSVGPSTDTQEDETNK